MDDHTFSSPSDEFSRSGSVEGAMTGKDIERLRAAEVVGTDSSCLLSIIDSAMDAIITVDEQHKVVLFNSAAERVFRVEPGAAIGRPLEDFIPERFRDLHKEYVNRFGITGSTQRSMGRRESLFGLRSDGREFPIEASISHSSHNGRRFFTVILRDISEKKRLEAQLLQAQKMESVGRMAGGIAHDFNNLLMAMSNYLALALRKLDPQHAARGYLSHMQEAADRAAGLTRQLLTFARKQSIHPTVICPKQVITGIEPMLRRLIGEDVVLRTALAPDTGSVLADVSQLEQVVMNLVVNARDAMPGGGTLTIESANAMLDEAYCRSHVGIKPGEYVLIAVSDTGTGMSNEVLARVFEPFFTTKEPGKGTGLGLATCHGIVNRHSGHIEIYSELGRGTSVKVYLPLAGDKAQSHVPVVPAAAPPGGKETILLAEDNDLVRNLAVAALREAGYNVIVAADGKQALSLANQHPGVIDLLLTDVVMPGMSGVALAEDLKAKRPSMRMIFMSGYTEETISGHGVPTEGTHFIAKPFMTDLMLRKVREVLDVHAQSAGA